MSFADTYLRRYATVPSTKLPSSNEDLYLTIVIPVYNEPGLLSSLGSLLNAQPPSVSWEVILVINEPIGCPQENQLQNLKSIDEVNILKNEVVRDDLQIHIIYPDPFPKKKAGPGLARKMGMDEAIRRYNQLDRPEGIIISFDADTSCQGNYLTELKDFFINHPKARGCTINFEHPLDNDFADAITQYELYLRYFKMSLEYLGFPYACYSLGSAFAVKAETYIKAGGMGLQQAGEDFYFLQKCIPLGEFHEINETCVFPSARISDRVVFGTGPFIEDFVNSKKEEHDVYPFELFQHIRPIFDWINELTLFPSSIDSVDQVIGNLPQGIRTLVKISGWPAKINKAYNDSASLIPFKKKFYHEISLLQIIHLFNQLSEKGYSKASVAGEFIKLKAESGLKLELKNGCELLELARGIEKNKGNIRIN